jgi:hypothetical protein
MKLIQKITLRLLYLYFINLGFCQTHIPYYQGIVDNCSLTSISTNLDEFVGHGVKSVGSTELVSAKDWLKAKYLSYGYTDIVEDDFLVGGNTVTNIIVTKIGVLYPDTFVIVDGHYDTINGVGANDNGSGTVLLLEIAKLLATVPTEYSIKFINFSAEETGLNGSQHYVNNVVNSTTPKMDIKLVINIDEVGGVNGLINDTIVCEFDDSNPLENNAESVLVTNELATCISLYSSLNTTTSYAYSSDYIPFENNGEIITGLYESNETSHAHTPTDIIANMDLNYLFKVIKGTIGAVLHFAIASESLSITDDVVMIDGFSFYPNPTKDFLILNFTEVYDTPVHFKLIDLNGKIVYTEMFFNTSQKHEVPLNNLASGLYVFELNIEGYSKVHQKIVVE